MDGGNQYIAGLTELNDHEVRVIIRETFQDPKMFGKVSFPALPGAEMTRGYIKDTMLRYDADEEDELGEDGDYLDAEERESGEEEEGEQEFEDTSFRESDE